MKQIEASLNTLDPRSPTTPNTRGPLPLWPPPGPRPATAPLFGFPRRPSRPQSLPGSPAPFWVRLSSTCGLPFGLSFSPSFLFGLLLSSSFPLSRESAAGREKSRGEKGKREERGGRISGRTARPRRPECQRERYIGKAELAGQAGGEKGELAGRWQTGRREKKGEERLNRSFGACSSCSTGG